MTPPPPAGIERCKPSTNDMFLSNEQINEQTLRKALLLCKRPLGWRKGLTPSNGVNSKRGMRRWSNSKDTYSIGRKGALYSTMFPPLNETTSHQRVRHHSMELIHRGLMKPSLFLLWDLWVICFSPLLKAWASCTVPDTQKGLNEYF